MKTIHCHEPREEDLALAAKLLTEGELVAFPTETVYGLGGNALNADAADKIYAAKGRPSDNPLIIHLAKASDADAYCVTSELYYRLTDVFCPGPLTIVLPKKANVPPEVTGGLETVAVRIPSHPVAHRLLELCSFPIAAPSANLSGKPSPTTYAHIEHDLDGVVSMLIDGGACEVGLESTIIKITGQDQIALLRPGAITLEMLAPFAPEGIRIDPAVYEKLPEGVRPEAPGMMYRHYAPNAKLILLDGKDEDVYAYLRCRESEGEAFGLLCYEEEMNLTYGTIRISLGKRADPLDQAKRLFDCLRQFNETDVRLIYAHMPDKSGIGLAVFNRLMKAAGYETITV